MLSEAIIAEISHQIHRILYEELLDIRSELTYLLGLTEVHLKEINPEHEYLQIVQRDKSEN